MSADTCINGHEMADGLKFCTTCGERSLLWMKESEVENRIVIDLGEDTDAPAQNIPGSIGQLSDDAPAAAKEKSEYEERLKLEKSRDEAYEKLHQLEEDQQKLIDWRSSNANSFLWRSFNRMTGELESAGNLLAQYNRTVDSLKIPFPGTMARLRKSFHRKYLWTTVIISVVTYLLYKIPHMIQEAERKQGRDFYTISAKRLIAYALILHFILLVSYLTTYYRGWTTYQRQVQTTLWKLRTVSQNVEHVRSEEARLKALYPQVREWFHILGQSLSLPWKIRPEWFESNIGRISYDSLPNSLRVAKPEEEDGPAMIGMQRFAAEQFMVKGWRSKVFADQVDVIREANGLPKDRLNVDTLDKDIMYSPNGPRSTVAKGIADEGILERVGRRQLIPLITQVQKEAITKSRPPVDEYKKTGIKVTKKSAEDHSESDLKQWDEFLSLAIPVTGKPRTPLSTFSLSDMGQAQGHHGNYKTFLIVPERFKDNVVGVDDRDLKVYPETSKLPMDIVIRADFAGPIPASDLLFLAKSAAQKAAKAKEETEILTAKLKERKSGI